MEGDLATSLMDEFAEATGVSGTALPRRYLWTDAFAVCNFLGLARQTGETRYLQFAKNLVKQVHHVLGRHRRDDPRQGWISGLSGEAGEEHPTRGGLRIGKKLNERGLGEPFDSQLEWERDGQYFHYLTKWMHALCRMGRETGDSRYQRWATELAVTAHGAFSRERFRGGPKGIVWKLSIDLTRPLVSSMGQHDPLDGLITFLELQNTGGGADAAEDLIVAIDELTEMCEEGCWTTEDPLGIGGLLDDATRLARLVIECGAERRELLHQLLTEAELSLRHFDRSSLLTQRRSVEHRRAFRELGLSIGMHGLQWLRKLATHDRGLSAACSRLLVHQPIANEIEAFWSDPAHRRGVTWLGHRDINTVMLATSLSPEGYFGFR